MTARSISAVLVSPDGVVADVTIDGVLASYQKAVGGYIEAVQPWDALGAVVGYVNEDGLRLGLPANIVASTLCGTPIVGPLLIVGRSGAVETDVPPGTGQRIRDELGPLRDELGPRYGD